VFRLRPPLSEQLNQITNQASLITEDILKRSGEGRISQPASLLRIPTSRLTVGKISSSFPSPLSCSPSLLQYQFHHHLDHKEINMEMHFSDMVECSLRGGVFRFKVRNG